MSKFLVYQANRNIERSCVNKSLRKDNKIFAKEVKANPKIRMKHILIVYTTMGIHFYNPSDFRIAKNQKLNKKIMGVINLMTVQCKNCRNCYVFNKKKNQYCCGATKNICLTNIKKQRACQYFIKRVKNNERL